MNLNKTSIILLLTVVVLVSGCSGSGGQRGETFSGPGIVVTSFDSDFSKVDSGQSVFVTVDFENQGDYVADTFAAELFRIGGFVGSTAPDNVITRLEAPLEGVFSSEQYYWSLRAPNVSQDRVEDVQARLSYNYTTEAFGTIHFTPRDFFLNQGGEVAFPADVTTTAGPIELDLTMNQPVIITQDEQGEDGNTVLKEIRFTILLANVGGGTAVSENTSHCGTGEDCIDTVKIVTTGDSCGVYQSATNTLIPASATNAQPVKLIRGTDGRISFPFTVNASTDAATSCQVQVTAEYRYRVDSSVLPITVLEKI